MKSDIEEDIEATSESVEPCTFAVSSPEMERD